GDANGAVRRGGEETAGRIPYLDIAMWLKEQKRRAGCKIQPDLFIQYGLRIQGIDNAACF
ncbi:hypothetical protein, partial [Serratia ureilytica]|uniref:hypothetical protein n=1 Tax=Serratia ureilytica TaxID=300181 RepID=UPI002362167D